MKSSWCQDDSLRSSTWELGNRLKSGSYCPTVAHTNTSFWDQTALSALGRGKLGVVAHLVLCLQEEQNQCSHQIYTLNTPHYSYKSKSVPRQLADCNIFHAKRTIHLFCCTADSPRSHPLFCTAACNQISRLWSVKLAVYCLMVRLKTENMICFRSRE